MKRFSVKIQILLFSMIPVLIIDVFLTTLNINKSLEQASQQLQSKGEITAKQIASAVEFYLFSGNRQQIQRLLNQSIADRDIIYAAVYGQQGRRVAEAQSPQYTPRLSNLYFYSREPVLTQVLESEDVFDPGPRARDREILGWVHLYVSREQLESSRERILMEGLLFFIVLLFIAFLLAALISQRITRPIFTLLESLRKIEQGDLGQVITNVAANEIGDVQRGFNSMSQSLLANRRELDQKINQATGDLREAIATLEDKNRELGLARDAAQEANRVKSQFLANISHEIRTPIKGIKGFVNLFKQTGLNRNQKRYINIIQQSTDDLNSMITELLDFSKLESGKVNILNSEFDLFNLLETTRDGLFSSAMEKGVDMHLTVFSDTPQMLIGDPFRLKQILRNLVGNAIKFTDKGHVSITVYILDEDDASVSIQFRIEDSGIGISEQHQSQLFRAFSQLETNPNRRYSGTGLGLVISRNLARLMGGDITLESSPGVGSIFTLQLPFELGQQPSPEQYPLSGKTAFVFAASRRCLTEVQSVLNRIGFITEVQLLESGEKMEAYSSQVEQNQPYLDFIVFDLRDNPIDPRSLLANIAPGGPRIILVHYDVALVDPELPRLYDFVSIINTGENIAQMLVWKGTEEQASKALAAPLPQSSRLLVVDDNNMNLMLAAELADLWGHSADMAKNATEAMQYFLANDYDLVLLDLQMPEVDGIQLMQMMRAEKPEIDCPIVSLSASDIEELEARRLLDLGFDSCLAKPLDEEKLNRLLQPGPLPHKLESRTQTKASSFGSEALETKQSIDLELSTKLCGKNPQLAKNMLRMFGNSIPEFQQQLEQARQQDSPGKIAYLAHKLRGATCYTGLPRLKALLIRYDESKHDQRGETYTITEAIIEELACIEQALEQLEKTSETVSS